MDQKGVRWKPTENYRRASLFSVLVSKLVASCSASCSRRFQSRQVSDGRIRQLASTAQHWDAGRTYFHREVGGDENRTESRVHPSARLHLLLRDGFVCRYTAYWFLACALTKVLTPRYSLMLTRLWWKIPHHFVRMQFRCGQFWPISRMETHKDTFILKRQMNKSKLETTDYFTYLFFSFLDSRYWV